MVLGLAAPGVAALPETVEGDLVRVTFTFDKERYAPGDDGRVMVTVMNASGAHPTLHSAQLKTPWGETVDARIDTPKRLGVDPVEFETAFRVPDATLPRLAPFAITATLQVPPAPDAATTVTLVGYAPVAASALFIGVATVYGAGVLILMVALARDARQGVPVTERPGFRLRSWATGAIASYGIYLFVGVPLADPRSDPVPMVAWIVLAGVAFSTLYVLPFALAKWSRFGLGAARADAAAASGQFRRLARAADAARTRPRPVYAVWGPTSLVLATLFVLVGAILASRGWWAFVPAAAFAALWVGGLTAAAKAGHDPGAGAGEAEGGREAGLS